MSLDGKILKAARERLDSRRRENEADLERRRQEVYARNPRLREIDRRLSRSALSAVTAAMEGGRDPVEALEAIREENLELQESRGMELLKMGLPMDYLEERYICPDCHDTGFVGENMCRCLRDLYKKEQRRELSQLLKMGEETFDAFDLSYYDDTPDPATGKSDRSRMEMVYDICSEYARTFSPSSLNLFLTGGPGLGKTFLSTCIARVVSERGFSVVYDTAISVFARYEAERFGRGDPEANRDELHRYETCDLLILDDLGTEFPTPLVNTSLYTLVNTRLTGGKKTVISSNLSPAELSGRYTPATVSRLTGEYTTLTFVGRDIRKLRR